MIFLNCIVNDLAEILKYIPKGIAVGGGSALFYALLKGRFFTNIKKKREITFKALFLCFAAGLYGYVFFQQTYFSRIPGSRTSVNMILFGTWGDSVRAHAYVIENILLFIPFGFFLGEAFKFIRKNGFFCVLIGFIGSVILETVQFISQRGHCQLDDVVMNTAGAFLGWLISRIYHVITGEKST